MLGLGLKVGRGCAGISKTPGRPIPDPPGLGPLPAVGQPFTLASPGQWFRQERDGVAATFARIFALDGVSQGATLLRASGHAEKILTIQEMATASV